MGGHMRRTGLFLITILAAAAAAAPASSRHARESSETVLYSFCDQNNCADGKEPLSTVTPDGQGNLFGATVIGGGGPSEICGSGGCGTIFEIRQRHGFPA